MSEGLGLDDGTGEPPDADPRHDVLAALDAVRSGLEWLREAADRAWALSEEDLRESVAGGYQTLAACQSTVLALVKVLDERPEAVPGASASRPAASFLQQRVRLDASRANADVRAAHALDPADGELPEVGAALAAGEITLEHADVCVRVLARLPKRLVVLDVVDAETGDTVTGMQLVDRVLSRFAREAQVRSVKQLVDQLVAILDPHRKERFDEDAHLRRSLKFLREDSTGMGLLRVTLTPAHAAVLEAAIKAWSAPLPAAEAAFTDESGTVQTTLVRDERTPAQRQYDALWSAVLAGFTGDRAGLARMPRVDLSIVATLDQLADAGLDMAALREQVSDRQGRGAPESFPGRASRAPARDAPGPVGCGPGLARLSRVGPVGGLLLGYLTCSAMLTRVLTDDLGRPLDVGRAHRLATDPQRRAISVRDGGCVWPGCTVPMEGAEIHHFHEWQHGGATDLVNLGAVCGRHHQMLHMGIGEVRVVDGHVHVRLPRWMDPERRWLRNTAHRALETAARVGQQLALAVDLGRQASSGPEAPAVDPDCWERTRTAPEDDDGSGVG